MTENVFDYDAKQRAQDIVSQIDQGKLPENPNYGHQGADAIGTIASGQGQQEGQSGHSPGSSSNAAVDDRASDVDDVTPSWNSRKGIFGEPADLSDLVLGVGVGQGMGILGRALGLVPGGVAAALGSLPMTAGLGLAGAIARAHPEAISAVVYDDLPEWMTATVGKARAAPMASSSASHNTRFHQGQDFGSMGHTPP